MCNLTCHHCFISCSPKNRSFGFLSLAEVRQRLEESVALGVKEYYFTGGEPFLNPELVPILVETLRYGPATVLTNATVLKDEWLRTLERENPDSIAIIDAALMIESGGYKRFDKIIVVWCDAETQIKRLMARNDLNRKAAIQRIEAQMPQEEKKSYADYAIDTSDGFEETRRRTIEIFERLKVLT